jgi:hypothetical protein
MVRPPMRRYFTLSFDMTAEEIELAMSFLKNHGYGEDPTGNPDYWMNMQLVSGESVDGSATNTLCRVIADPRVTYRGHDNYRLELDVEDEGPPDVIGDWV